MLDLHHPVKTSDQGSSLNLPHLGRIRCVDFQINIMIMMEWSRVIGVMLTGYRG